MDNKKDKSRRGRTNGRPPPPTSPSSATSSPKKYVGAPREKTTGEFFDSWSDADFYSDKATHVYFFNDLVDDGSVRQLRDDIHAANVGSKTAAGAMVDPKPIVVHVNSPGGKAYAGMRLMTVFKECRVPICTLVEGYSCSAATFLTLLAPYRVMTQYATTLIHELAGMVGGKFQDIKSMTTMWDANEKLVRDVYLRKTRIPPSKLDELMKHDIDLDAETCMAYGMVERVLRFGATHPPPTSPQPNTRLLLTKTNINRFNATCDVGQDCQRFDAMIAEGGDELKTVVFYPYRSCFEMDFLNKVFAFVPRIQALRTPCYSILDTTVEITDYIPSLFCTRRFMYEHATVVFWLRTTMFYGTLLEDRVKNTRLYIDRLRALLKRYTKVPNAVLDDIPRRVFELSAHECLKYGLCDELIRL